MEQETKRARALKAVHHELMRLLNAAQVQRSSVDTHHETSVDELLIRCHNERRGIMSADEKAVADELCHVGLEFGKRKAVNASDLISDLVRNSIDQPLFAPTEDPELPASAEDEILLQVKRALYEQGFVGDLKSELIQPLKAELLAREKEVATRQSAIAEKRARDHLEEIGYRGVMAEVIDDFVSMPYCVVRYPHYEYVDTPSWNRDTWVVEPKLTATAKRISPFDFYLLGGTTPKTAQACIAAGRVHKHALAQMRKEPNWFADAIDAEIERTSVTTPTPVLRKNKERSEMVMPVNIDELEVYTFEGKVPRKLLLDTGVAVNSKEPFIEIVAEFTTQELLHLRQQKANSALFRSYHATSYERLNGSLAGIGILQRVHKAARIARAMTFAAIRNAGYTARPTGEVDVERIKEHYPNFKQEMSTLMFGQLYFTNPDLTGQKGGVPAINLWNIPNVVPQLTNAITFFLELLDMLSMVPKVGSGDMRGLATLGRSFRGIALVQAAESKTVKGALDNFDRDIQESIFRRMYDELVESGVKGDARVMARGTSGYLMKEANAAARQEALTAMAPWIQTLPEKLVTDLIGAVVKDFGIDVDRYNLPAAQAAQDNPLDTATSSPSFGGQEVRV